MGRKNINEPEIKNIDEPETKNVNKPGIKKETLVDKISTHSKGVMTIAGVFAVVYPLANNIFNMLYQTKCENLYHIPGKYFHESIDYRLLYLGCIVLLILMSAFPIFMKKYDEKKGKTSKETFVYSVFLSLIIGLEMGLFNVYNLIEIMRETYDINKYFNKVNDWLNNHPTFTIGVVIVMGSLSLVGIVLLNQIRNVRAKFVKSIVSVLFTVSLFISIFLIIYGTVFKLSISIEDKTKYEVVTEQDNKYIVLSEYEDNLLVVKYKQEDGRCILLTDEYLFLDKFKCRYNYVSMKKAPQVELTNEIH